MFTDYDGALAFIHNLPRLTKTADHTNLLKVLAALDHPERHGHFIHVTGTNGKGSTTNMIASILQRSGLTVGMFTSPFINRFNERIQIDRTPISDAELLNLAQQVAGIYTELRAQDSDFVLKEFEFVTAMGFAAFAQHNVDVAVIEVGIGGAHDATTVIQPDVAVITNVALDHTRILGHTIAAIATEKSGIIKSGCDTVTADLVADAMGPVRERTTAVGSKLASLGDAFAISGVHYKNGGTAFKYQDGEGSLSGLWVPLAGDYQAHNAAVAVRAAKTYARRQQWPLKPMEIKRGLQAATVPARMEVISTEPTIVLDGAHNPDGMRHALGAVSLFGGAGDVVIIAGILHDKDLDTMMGQLARTEWPVIYVPVPDNPRAATATEYTAVDSDADVSPSWQDALALILAGDASRTVVIMGSLYLVSDVRQTLLGTK
ncbi:bifunctional folylpolyglutamate synthase/dihydrofolate synthase [Lacticaseibacillus thailandensis]|uniref:tetrahydrofolate synthase n=1 Tax=Lacticaseibacillus thailandensis DSM 22698 = JCM 13996 TaxID=1423810 RepID=A0A0R2C8L6_9LACO|nr:folylpolyglutamate synthase/dihydrofolate synthase family protein [Lacticaseibacillus thailandensis]KRM87911.1 hypothetical protein FD19_GL000189 [Lacticaseibacillus thailandensis DSM 22698 = JCM 13996]